MLEYGYRESLPLTDMWYINGRVESIVLHRKVRDFLYNEGDSNEENRILHYIVKLDDSRESAFLIQDMFPITEKYIEREYTIAGNHLMLTSEHTVKEIEQKARKVMGMIKRGVKFTPTQPDVMAILKKLQ